MNEVKHIDKVDWSKANYILLYDGTQCDLSDVLVYMPLNEKDWGRLIKYYPSFREMPFVRCYIAQMHGTWLIVRTGDK